MAENATVVIDMFDQNNTLTPTPLYRFDVDVNATNATKYCDSLFIVPLSPYTLTFGSSAAFIVLNVVICVIKAHCKRYQKRGGNVIGIVEVNNRLMALHCLYHMANWGYSAYLAARLPEGSSWDRYQYLYARFANSGAVNAWGLLLGTAALS
eukprot:gene18631-6063_t